MTLVGKLRRFFFVKLVGGRVKHRVFKTRGNPVEGDLTECGIPVTAKWYWIHVLSSQKKRVPTCKRCENAAG